MSRAQAILPVKNAADHTFEKAQVLKLLREVQVCFVATNAKTGMLNENIDNLKATS